MNEFLNGITGKVTIISIAAFILGSCIITSHLSSFQILDYDLLKPHAIIVGFVFLLFIGINILVFSYRAGSNENNSFSILKLVTLGVLKIPFLSLLIFFACEPSMIDNPDYKLSFLSYSIDTKGFSISAMFLIISLFFYLIILENEETKNYKKIRYTLIFISVIPLFLLFSTFIRHSTFTKIFLLEVSIWFNITVLIVAYRSSKMHEERLNKGLEKAKWSDSSLFEFGKSELGVQLTKLFYIIAIIFLGLMITFNYTNCIYSNLSQSFGGGELIKMSFVVNNDTITGNKVYETKEYVFLSQKDSTIIKLDWNNINSILKTPMK